MTLNADAMIELETLKIYLQVDEDTFDQVLEKFINAVSRLMIREIGHNPVNTTYTSVKLDGTGKPMLLLPHFPIFSVDSVTENGTSLTEDTDFLIYENNGYLLRISSNVTAGNPSDLWAEGNQNIIVSYKAGYYVGTNPSDGSDPMPNDLEMACAKQIGIEHKRFGAEDWDQTAKTFPDGSIAKNIVELHPQVKEICRKYRRIII